MVTGFYDKPGRFNGEPSIGDPRIFAKAEAAGNAPQGACGPVVPNCAKLYGDLYAAVMDAFGDEVRAADAKTHYESFPAVAADVLGEKAAQIRLLQNVNSLLGREARVWADDARKADATANRMAKAMAEAAPGLWFQASREVGTDFEAITRRAFEMVREKAAAEAIESVRVKSAEIYDVDGQADHTDVTIRFWKNPPQDNNKAA